MFYFEVSESGLNRRGWVEFCTYSSPTEYDLQLWLVMACFWNDVQSSGFLPFKKQKLNIFLEKSTLAHFQVSKEAK